jgi:chromosome segregation ATPase
MAGDEKKEVGEVKTTIDALLDIIKSKGLVDISAAAATLGIAAPVAEQWAKVLEENNLVKISYRVGKMFVEPMSVSKGDIKLVTAKIETRRDMLEEEVSVQLEQINKIGDIIEAAKISAGNAETIFKQKAPEEQQMLNELNRVYNNVEKQYAEIEDAKKKVEETNDRINKSLTDTLSKIAAYSSSDIVKNIEETRERMSAAIKSVSEVNAAANSIIKQKDKAFEDIRKKFAEQVAAEKAQMDKEFKDINNRLQVSLDQVKIEENKIREQNSSLRAATEGLETFNKEKAAMEKELNAARVHFNDQYLVRRQELEKNLSLFDDKMKTFYSKVKEMKDAFGDVANIFDSIEGAKKDLAEVTTKLASAKVQAQGLQEALKALSSSDMPVGQSADAVDKIARDIKGLNATIDDVRGGITKAASNIKPTQGTGTGEGDK